MRPVRLVNSSYSKQTVTWVRESSKPFAMLLEAPIVSPDWVIEKCIWTKNDEVIDGNCPLLCFEVADVTPHGIYKCYWGTSVHPQAVLKLHIESPIDRFVSVFSERYKSCVAADVDAWPQVSQTTYINLAVVKTQAEQYLNTFTSETIRGDADDIHGVKGETSYEDAIEGIKHGEVMIVEGRPGSGKTTLVHKISQDWIRIILHKDIGEKYWKWSHIKALFLVHLRGLLGNPHIKLVDLIKPFFGNKQSLKIICDYITLKDGAGICFILDGLDEYQPNNRDNFIFKLMNKKILPKSIVIVASRPAAVAEYRLAKKHIEVLGFFKEQISDYIDSYNFPDDPVNSRSSLKQYLKECPNVYHMCYLPIQLAMVCFLFNKMKGTLPNTETAIYVEFTKHTILRSFHRVKRHDKIIESIFSMSETENQLFLSICTIAFDKTLSSKQVLVQSEVDLLCKTLNTSFGLLTIDREATMSGFQSLYTFCHLTLQEFLAACHIFMAERQHQIRLVEICK